MRRIVLSALFLLAVSGMLFPATYIIDDGASIPEEEFTMTFSLAAMEKYEYGFTSSNSSVITHPGTIRIIPQTEKDGAVTYYSGTAHTYVYCDMLGGSRKQVYLGISGPLTAPSGNTIHWTCTVGDSVIYSDTGDEGGNSKEMIWDFSPPYESGSSLLEKYSAKDNLLVMIEVVSTPASSLTAEQYSSSIVLEIVDYSG